MLQQIWCARCTRVRWAFYWTVSSFSALIYFFIDDEILFQLFNQAHCKKNDNNNYDAIIQEILILFITFECVNWRIYLIFLKIIKNNGNELIVKKQGNKVLQLCRICNIDEEKNWLIEFIYRNLKLDTYKGRSYTENFVTPWIFLINNTLFFSWKSFYYYLCE